MPRLRLPLLEHVACHTVRLPNGCLEWQLTVDSGGYASIWIDGQTQRLHRVLYMQCVGALTPDEHLDHRCHTRDKTCPGGKTCRHRRCLDLTHLEPVTFAENVLVGRGPTAINAAKTHCVRGHLLTGDNVYETQDGRQCRPCNQVRAREAWLVKQGRPLDWVPPVPTTCRNGHPRTPETFNHNGCLICLQDRRQRERSRKVRSTNERAG